MAFGGAVRSRTTVRTKICARRAGFPDVRSSEKEDNHLIEVKHLTKRYGTQLAIDDLSFTIEPGQIYGLLGPNGAGKTTTMNIMTGCLAATYGEVKIDGHDIFEEAMEAKKLIGYLPEQPPLYMDRTPKEYLTFVGRAKGIPAKELPDQIAHVMKVTQITAMADRLIKNLSKGYKQRVGIAQAILGDPEIIILDEPTVGLDPHQIIEIRDLITSLGKGHTIILSSHILSEVQAVCQTILIISKGKLIACDTPEKLEQRMSGTTTISLTAECPEEKVRAVLEPLEDIDSIEVVSADDNRCQLRLTTKKEESDPVCRELFFAFARENTAILELSVVHASLEQVFIELTSDKAPSAQSGLKDRKDENEEPDLPDEDTVPEENISVEDISSPLEDLSIDEETLDIQDDSEEKEAEET